MKINTATFIISNTDISKCPHEEIPEYAFIGRSNVGKSSLINMLTNRKNLAKTSNTPGKTQLVNHFKINEAWFLVDLPGYGYARVSKKERSGFKKIIYDYFNKRLQLVCTFVLIDMRHSPQKIDLEFMQYLGEHQLPFCIVFTKSDKLSQKALNKNLKNYRNEMLQYWVEMPKYIVSSSVSKQGKDEILDYIHTINVELNSNE